MIKCRIVVNFPQGSEFQSIVLGEPVEASAYDLVNPHLVDVVRRCAARWPSAREIVLVDDAGKVAATVDVADGVATSATAENLTIVSLDELDASNRHGSGGDLKFMGNALRGDVLTLVAVARSARDVYELYGPDHHTHGHACSWCRLGNCLRATR